MTLRNVDREQVTKAVLAQASVETSSDLITVLFEIFKGTKEYSYTRMSPVYEIEDGNWHTGEKNIQYSELKLDEMDRADLVDAEEVYTFVIELFLKDVVISRRFKLDEFDETGWAILKELNEKRDYCKRLINIKKMRDEL